MQVIQKFSISSHIHFTGSPEQGHIPLKPLRSTITEYSRYLVCIHSLLHRLAVETAVPAF